jgi:hypothetical protein
MNMGKSDGHNVPPPENDHRMAFSRERWRPKFRSACGNLKRMGRDNKLSGSAV